MIAFSRKCSFATVAKFSDWFRFSEELKTNIEEFYNNCKAAFSAERSQL